MTAVGCLSLVAANLLWMYHLTDRPEPEDVQFALERRSQVPGEVTTSTMLLYLLERGLRMHHIYPFDDRRFIAEGEAYYREFYADEWEPDWDKYLTPKLLEELRQECEAHRVKFDQYGEVSTEENRPVTYSDIPALLQRQGAVVLYSATAVEPARASHGFAYGTNDGELKVYWPHRGTSLLAYTPDEFTEYWLPSDGVTAIWEA
ncbi:hypothetical protein [Microbispora sp. NPDC049125]|uniref:hypothetical protein n=1 Tax=Microbispora sp. NPDC049125 TaxID=3154929 RepID=UPI0034678B74